MEFQKLIRTALAFCVVASFSACTKAQLIGSKQLTSVKYFSVVSISPSSGPKSGGTTVTLVGTGFVSGMSVKIGGITCSSVQVVSSTIASCVTGVSSVAAVDTVAVVNGDGNTDSSMAYTYLGVFNTSAARIAAGGNALSSGGAGANKVSARTTVGAVFNKTGNVSTGGAGASKVTVRGGVIGVYTLH